MPQRSGGKFRRQTPGTTNCGTLHSRNVAYLGLTGD
jgi:hypothetical protein